MSEKFEYNYEAPTIEERKEIDSIRAQYLPPDERTSKLQHLKSLHKKVKGVPTAIALACGIVGILTFGLGLTFYLEWTNFWYLGIPISAVGIFVTSIAYPLYVKIHRVYRYKYGDEIISLSNELLFNDDGK